MSEELTTFGMVYPGSVALGFSFPEDRPPTVPNGGDAPRQRTDQVSMEFLNLSDLSVSFNVVQVQFPASYRPASNFFDVDFTQGVASGAQTPNLWNAEQKITGTTLKSVTVGPGGHSKIGPFSVNGDVYILGTGSAGAPPQSKMARLAVTLFGDGPTVVSWKDPEQPIGDTRARSYVSPFSFTIAALANGKVSTAGYSQTVAAVNGSGAVTYAVTSGSLPTGLSLNTGTGNIHGTPSVAGTYTFTITATDASTATVAQPFTITVTT